MKKYLSYLPFVFSEIREFCALGEVIDRFISLAYSEISDAYGGLFMNTANGKWLTRHEDFFGIIPADGESAGSRRFHLLTTAKGELPYTKRTLISRLTDICGEENFTVEENSAECTLTVTLGLEAQKSYDEAVEMLRRIVPSNLSVTVTQQFKTYGEIESAGLKYGGLDGMTHDEIRRGVWEA